MLRLHSLHIGYPHRDPLIELFSDTLNIGDCVGLIGRNGSGKSTLLKSIAGLIPPVSGEIFWHDRTINNLNLREKTKLIAFIGTRRAIPSMLYVLDAVMMGRNPYKPVGGAFNEDDRALAMKALLLVGMSDFHARYLSELSDGEIQKVMIARAITQQAQVVMFDEPTAFLDFVAKDEFGEAIQILKASSVMIFSSHDLQFVNQMASKKWIIDEKKKQVEISY
jgi:iron complex transport system ATP-binding protein